MEHCWETEPGRAGVRSPDSPTAPAGPANSQGELQDQGQQQARGGGWGGQPTVGSQQARHPWGLSGASPAQRPGIPQTCARAPSSTTPTSPVGPSTSKGVRWPQTRKDSSRKAKQRISVGATAWPSSPIRDLLGRIRGRATPLQGCPGQGQNWTWADPGLQTETPGNGGDPSGPSKPK